MDVSADTQEGKMFFWRLKWQKKSEALKRKLKIGVKNN